MKIQNIEDLKELNLKLEYRNPTGNFRDTTSSLIILDTISKNKNLIVNLTTGSFGISLASYSTRVGVNIVNVIPKNIDSFKIEQMKIYNSEVIIDGDYIDSAIDEVQIIVPFLSFLLFSFFFSFFGPKIKTFFGVNWKGFFWIQNRKKEILFNHNSINFLLHLNFVGSSFLFFVIKFSQIRKMRMLIYLFLLIIY